MKKKDISLVQKVARTSWYTTYEGIIPREVQESFLNIAYNDEMLKKRLKQSSMFVAEIDGKLVGFANFSPVNQEGMTELIAIYLHPDYQGKGIGTALLEEGIQRLRGVQEIHINVEKNNSIGMNFYKAKGFAVASEFDDDFEGHILKTVRMVLEI
jgi:ribosomal protein S18 acetylase RimI-like enzyme